MLAAALEAEVAAYIAAHADELDERGRRLVVRNGRAEPRQVLTSAGAVEVRRAAGQRQARRRDHRASACGSPRRSCRRGAASPRRSPRCCRCCTCTACPVMDFVPALEGFLGTGAGLSAATVTRLTAQWQDEARTFGDRDLSTVDYVYLWADGMHLDVRLDEEKLCLLVMIGVRVDGTKELVALADGYRESTGSWADLLRDCKRRGMRAPVLAVGDGALGFWGGAARGVPETREQRCWFHKIANVLSALPKSAHPGGQEGPGRDLERRGPRARPPRRRGVQAGLRRQVRQSRRQDHRRSRRAARVLRLPGRALDPSAHNESRSSRPSPPCGTAPRSPKAPGPRPPAWPWRSSSSRPRRPAGARSTHHTSSPSSAPAPLRTRQTRRTTRHRVSRRRSSIVKISHPQVLTIAPVASV